MSWDFFSIGKMLWAATQPENWLIGLAGLAVILLLVNWHKGARIYAGMVFAALIALKFLALDNALLRPLETRFELNAPQSVDGIIVLGGAGLPPLSKRWNQPVLSDRGERILVGLALAKKHPNARVIYTGRGEELMSLDRTSPIGADIMALAELDHDRFTRERASRSTWENAVFTFDLARPDPHETWLLVTSGWHMPRSVGAFCAVGFQTIPYPVDYLSGYQGRSPSTIARRLTNISVALHEYVGLIGYYLSGRTHSIFSKGC